MFNRVFITLLAAGTVLSSCASLAPLPSSDIDAKVAAVLDGPSHVDPLELSVTTDFVRENINLVRTFLSATGKSDQKSPDEPLGLYFGNGLFFDADSNLNVRVDRLAGVTDHFSGTTEYFYHNNSDENGTLRSATYQDNTITIKDPAPFLLHRDDKVDLTKEKVKFNAAPFQGRTITFSKSGVIKIQSDGLFTTPTTYTTVPNGVNVSWWESAVLIPVLKTDKYTLSDNKIVDSEKTILVENTGAYLRFTFTKGDKYSFRVYRTNDQVLIFQENNGAMILLQKTNNGFAWKEHLIGAFEMVTDKIVDYHIAVTPTP